MSKCESCRHAIFDEVWGEHKCLVRKVRTTDAGNVESCALFMEKKGVKKDTEVREKSKKEH